MFLLYIIYPNIRSIKPKKKQIFSYLLFLHIPKVQEEPDFTRERKLSFFKTMQFLLAANGNTVSKELLEFFDFSPDTASSSAFSQQRAKLLPDAFNFLFHSFTESFANLTTYLGYRLVACDGSDLAISYNPKDSATYRRHNSVELKQKGYNQLHLNALYDLSNRIYLDALVQPGSHPDEAEP